MSLTLFYCHVISHFLSHFVVSLSAHRKHGIENIFHSGDKKTMSLKLPDLPAITSPLPLFTSVVVGPCELA